MFISYIMRNVNCGKSCGLDGIYGEHLKYVNGKLHVLLSLLFNASTIIHGHVPKGLMDNTCTFIQG